MYTDRKEFIHYLDNSIPEEIAKKYSTEHLDNPTYIEFSRSEEKSRCETIQLLISSTHSWHQIQIRNPDGFEIDALFCGKCYYRASIFNYISHLELIEKIHNNLPTYDIHSEYLMYTCDEVIDLKEKLSKEPHQKPPCNLCFLPAALCSNNLFTFLEED